MRSLGSRFRTVQNGRGTIPFVSGSAQKLDIIPGLINKAMVLRLSGNLVVAAANATVFSEAPLGLIRRVALIGDGNRYFANLDARGLHALTRRMNRKKSELAAPLGTVGTRAFSAMFKLDAAHWNVESPFSSLLDTRLFKTLTLEITWGAATDIATAGGGGTIAIDAATVVDVLTDDTAEGIENIYYDHILTTSEINITASNQKTKVDDIPQSGLLVGFLARTTRDAGAGAGPVPVDDIVNSFTLRSDTSIVHIDRAKWRTLQSKDVLDFLLDGGDATTGQHAGYVYVPLIENGDIDSALNVNALNRATLEADATRTSGTETLHIVWDFLEARENSESEVAA